MLLKNHIKKDLQRGEGGHTSPETEAATAELLTKVDANRKKVVNLGPKERDVELALDVIERQKDYTHPETISHFEKLGQTPEQFEAEKAREAKHAERTERFRSRDEEEARKLSDRIAHALVYPKRMSEHSAQIAEQNKQLLNGPIDNILGFIKVTYGINVDVDGSMSIKNRFKNFFSGRKAPTGDTLYDSLILELQKRGKNVTAYRKK